MTKLSMSTRLGTSAKRVWDLIGGFGAMPDWHPGIEKSEIEEEGGVTQRRLTLVGGAVLVERLEQLDDEGRSYNYTIVSSPLPISNYRSTISIVDDAEGNATVEWSGEFDADGGTEAEMTKVVEGIYQAGLDNLKKMFGG